MQRHYHYPDLSAMSITEQRNRVPELLDQVDDEFFSAVYAMLETYVRKQQEDVKIVSYDAVTGEARSSSELTEILDKEVEAVRQGDYITIEDFRKESAQWVRRTK